MTRVATRDEQIAEAKRLRAEGHKYRQIAERFDVSKGTIARWTNDDYAERHRATARAVKERYRGTCETCGAATSGCNGPGTASDTCARCTAQQQRDAAVWTRERLIAEAHRWKQLVGRFPVSTDWHTGGGPPSGSPGRRQATREFRALTGLWPTHASVRDRFGSWAEFIRTLGGAPAHPGGRDVPHGFRERELRDAIDRIKQRGTA